MTTHLRSTPISIKMAILLTLFLIASTDELHGPTLTTPMLIQFFFIYTILADYALNLSRRHALSAISLHNA